MTQYLNVTIALIVFMGLVSGGMLALVLMTTRRYQWSFSIILGLAALLAVLGVFASVSFIGNLAEGLTNAVVLLILSFALGYALTTFSVLSFSNRRSGPLRRGEGDNTAVILLAPGEPANYGVESASRRLALADDPQDVPPVLLRPFYLRDLRTKYAALGPSPFKDYHTELAAKVQTRLDPSHRIYNAFYSDRPSLADALTRAIQEGARRIVLTHLRVSDPPDPVLAGELLQGIIVEDYGAKLIQVGPLWDSELIPQIFVRRVLEAAPQFGAEGESVGLLLIGRGHDTSGGQKSSATRRQRQETTFQNRVRAALVKQGFAERQIALAWVRWSSPSIVEGVETLAKSGCKHILWMPSSYPADGVITLYDIPEQLKEAERRTGIPCSPLGAWDADDLAAEEIAARVRAAVGSHARTATVRSAG